MQLPIQQRHFSTPEVVDPGVGSSAILIRAHVLIPGRGEPIYDAAMVVKGSKIDWVGVFQDRPAQYHGISPAYSVQILMPGLWDSHCHYDGLDLAVGFEANNYLPGGNALIGAVTAYDLERTLMAGYTSVRELGGHAGDLVPGIQAGYIVGPNVYSAHTALSITGGHGDDHSIPIATVMEGMHHGGVPVGICDGKDECIKAVRLMIRRGARVIKVCASGGVLSLNDDPEDRQFSDEELCAIVQEAARSRRAVAAHAIGKAGIMAALRAGVRSIEHGIYLDEEAIELMKEKGAYLVATQHIIRTLSEDYMDRLPPQSRSKLAGAINQSMSAYRLAVKSGVNIALGTDMLSSDPRSKLSHGNNAKELLWAVEAGMTPLQAIESATANGPETLGAMAPLSGQLREGYDADFLTVRKNPLDDISVLADRNNIMQVWKGGKLYKNIL